MGTLKLALGVGVFALIIILGIKLVPIYVDNFEFEDALKNDALQSTYSTKSEDEIRELVIKHARDCDIELTPKQVHVAHNGGFGTGTLVIEVNYTVPVSLPGYSTTLEFNPTSKNQGVY
jgi:hypothetical protein